MPDAVTALAPERAAILALACCVEPGTPGLAELVAEAGPIQALARVRTGALRGTLPGPPPTGAELASQLGILERRGVRVVLAGDAEYPTQLLDLAEPPLALWLRGPLDLRVAALRSVAVVGARACTAYGERATEQIVTGLAEAGWAVVSGAAFGIDAAAHRAALSAQGPTVAVLACGIDIVYPRAHDALVSRIGDAGLVVTELPPGSQPLKFRFLARNRLIAALTRGTVVVEAARRSGAIATANRALELSRELMAVPGPVTSMASSGTNRLLFERSARAVSDAGEVIEVLLEGGPEGSADGVDRGAAGSCPPPPPPGRPGNPDADLLSGAELWGLPEPATTILAALPARGRIGLDGLARRVGLDPVIVLAHLGMLEIRGLARRTASGWGRST